KSRGVRRFGRGGITADLPAAANGSSTRLSASKARSAISRLAVICGNSASAAAKSCACPGVSRKRRGLPSASTSAWILVLRPPRLRPSAWSSTFFESAGTGVMRPDEGAVDHRFLVFARGSQMLKDPPPSAGCAPGPEPPVRILPVAEALRQVASWYSCTVPVQHRLDKATIVTGGGTDVAQLAGKQVLNPFPLVVAKSIAGHASAFYKADPA